LFGGSQTITAVDHVDLKVRRGELFGLLGPNGAGKTTFIKILCTLLIPEEGEAYVNGFNVMKEDMEVRKSLGTLFSSGGRGFHYRLTGYRNLEMFAALYNVPRKGRHERIMELLKLVGLEERAHDGIQKYSGGMWRKIILARALLPDPPVFLLDEPTAGLDVASSQTIRKFIKDLSEKQDKTIIYTTHYIEEAAQLCDRIGVLNKGRLIACDTPDAIVAMVKKYEVVEIRLEKVTKTQEDKLRSLSCVLDVTSSKDPVTSQQTLRLQIEGIESLQDVLNFLSDERIKLLDLKREEPGLADALLELIGKDS